MKFEIEFITSHIEARTGTVEIEAKDEEEARDLFSGRDYNDKDVEWERSKQLEHQTQIESISEIED